MTTDMDQLDSTEQIDEIAKDLQRTARHLNRTASRLLDMPINGKQPQIGDPTPPLPPDVPAQHLQLFSCVGAVPDYADDPSDGLMARIPFSTGIDQAIMVWEGYFDPGKTGRTTSDTWRSVLDERTPPDFSGPIILDREAPPAGEAFKVGALHPAHAEIVADSIELAVEVKSHRPEALVGFYGLPLREYWDQGAQWRQASTDLASLFEACDAVYPSIYDLYGHKPERDAEKYGGIVEVALSFNRPVYPIFWDRYHNSTNKWGFAAIPDVELVAHLVNALTVRDVLGGAQAAGVVWWGADPVYWKGASATREMAFENDGPWWDRIRSRFANEIGSHWMQRLAFEHWFRARVPYVWTLMLQAREQALAA